LTILTGTVLHLLLSPATGLNSGLLAHQPLQRFYDCPECAVAHQLTQFKKDVDLIINKEEIRMRPFFRY